MNTIDAFKRLNETSDWLNKLTGDYVEPTPISKRRSNRKPYGSSFHHDDYDYDDYEYENSFGCNHD